MVQWKHADWKDCKSSRRRRKQVELSDSGRNMTPSDSQSQNVQMWALCSTWIKPNVAFVCHKTFWWLSFGYTCWMCAALLDRITSAVRSSGSELTSRLGSGALGRQLKSLQKSTESSPLFQLPMCRSSFTQKLFASLTPVFIITFFQHLLTLYLLNFFPKMITRWK